MVTEQMPAAAVPGFGMLVLGNKKETTKNERLESNH